MNAGRYAVLAREVIADIHARGRVGIVCGGSGLYIRALFHGLAAIPTIDPAIRARLRKRYAEDGIESLRRELIAVDRESAARLKVLDPQRVIRALEVFEATHKPWSAFLNKPALSPLSIPSVSIGIAWRPPALLRKRIEARARALWDGIVEETRTLLRGGLADAAMARGPLGTVHALSFLRGETTADDALHATIRATFAYAKRQRTWFARDPSILWFHPEEAGLIDLQRLDVGPL